MSPEQWEAVDGYLEELLTPADAGLDAALHAAEEAGLPAIQVPALQGKFLQLLATAIGARRILEVGTLAGYSTIWLARALPGDGELITLEVDPEHARIASANLDAAGLSDRVRVVVGPALETLPSLVPAEPFDLVFIDADKVNNSAYLSWAIRLGRPGTVIVVDNVVRRGAVVDAASTDPSVVGTRKVLQMLADDPRVEATAIQTVGTKGYDGFALAVIRST